MQRFFDMLFSSGALLLLMPILVVVTVILALTGEREIFFVQQRVGKNGKLFGLLKFATMLKASPTLGTGTITMKNDPRVLPFGRYLRKTKLNELPQLVNILMGDMSVIGPRPQTPRCFEAFPEDVQRVIVKVRPGLSGIGSIVFRDEERLLDKAAGDRISYYDNVIAPYKGELEKWYIRHASIYIYFVLIYLTIWYLVFPDSKLCGMILGDLPEPPRVLSDDFTDGLGRLSDA